MIVSFIGLDGRFLVGVDARGLEVLQCEAMPGREIEDLSPTLDRLRNQLSPVESETALEKFIEALPVIHGWLHGTVGS